jgi:hypothetical protein
MPLACRAMDAARIVALTVACAAVLGLGACGGSGKDDTKAKDEQQVRTTLRDLGRATASKDYTALCDKVFARRLVNRSQAVGIPCETAMKAALANVEAPSITVAAVAVKGKDEAEATVKTVAKGQAASTDKVHLIKESGHWRVDRLGGAQPQAAAGTDQIPKPRPNTTGGAATAPND